MKNILLITNNKKVKNKEVSIQDIKIVSIDPNSKDFFTYLTNKKFDTIMMTRHVYLSEEQKKFIETLKTAQ